MLHTFIDVHTYYTGHLWQDEDLVLDEVEIDRGSTVYLPAFKTTTSTVPMSTTPATAPGLPLHSHEFVMISNHWYMELGSQPSLPPQPNPQPTPSPSALPGGEDHTSPVPGSTLSPPSPTPSQLGSQGA